MKLPVLCMTSAFAAGIALAMAMPLPHSAPMPADPVMRLIAAGQWDTSEYWCAGAGGRARIPLREG